MIDRDAQAVPAVTSHHCWFFRAYGSAGVHGMSGPFFLSLSRNPAALSEEQTIVFPCTAHYRSTLLASRRVLFI